MPDVLHGFKFKQNDRNLKKIKMASRTETTIAKRNLVDKLHNDTMSLQEFKGSYH